MARIESVEQKLNVILGNERLIFATLSLDGIVTSTEGAGLLSIGLRPGDLVGQSGFLVAHDDRENLQILERALKGEAFTAHGGFMGRVFEVKFTPIRSSSGKLEGIALVALDITEHRQTERERALMAEISKLPLTKTDEQEVCDSIARMILGTLADYCYIDMFDKKGDLHSAALAHIDPMKEDLMFGLQSRYSTSARQDHPLFRVARTGNAELHEKITQEMFRKGANTEAEYQIYLALNPTSGMVVPIRTWDGVLGTIAIARAGDSKPFDKRDLAVADELGTAVGLAIHTVRSRSAAGALVAK